MQQNFVYQYITCWNGTKAAIAAGYSEKTARFQASRLLTNVNIKAAIDEALEQSAMSAREVLARLSQEAAGDISDFLDESGNVVLTDRPTQLIKRFTQKKTTRTADDFEVEYTTTIIELYDAQAAKVHLGKYHGLFVDKSEIEHRGTLQATVTVYMPENGRE